jgi:hypothetical protein
MSICGTCGDGGGKCGGGIHNICWMACVENKFV